jgi:hypothetical protein
MEIEHEDEAWLRIPIQFAIYYSIPLQGRLPIYPRSLGFWIMCLVLRPHHLSLDASGPVRGPNTKHLCTQKYAVDEL